MPNIGPMELIIVLVVALLILGPKRLPSAGRSLGRGLREFKDSVAGLPPKERDEPQPVVEERTAST
jgi:sec-independent protein translocase protein TatA